MHKMSEDLKKPGVIVLGHPRSGTTLLRRWLDAHPAFAAPPETHLLSAAGRFLHSEKTSLGVDMGVMAGLHFAGFEDKVVLERLRVFVSAFFEEYAASQNAKRWVEKTAFDVFFTDRIGDLFSDRVQYVGIVRHPLDVAISTLDFCNKAGVYPDSLRPFVQNATSPLGAFVASWKAAFENLKALSERFPENFIMLRYEDMVEAPEEMALGLYDFLGEEIPDDVLKIGGNDVLGFSDHRTFETKGFDKSRSSRWTHLPENQVLSLTNDIRGIMEDLDYSLPKLLSQTQVDEGRRAYLVGQYHNLRKEK
jgi:protein-tyrosine sulfotransferase